MRWAVSTRYQYCREDETYIKYGDSDSLVGVSGGDGLMAVVYAGQVQTSLKEIVRRNDGAVTRRELIESATLELGIDRERVVTQLETLDQKGEVYHVGDGDDAEVRVP